MKLTALGRNETILSSAVKQLLNGMEQADTGNFEKILLVTPTAESCRLLREELAGRFANGVINLTVIQPERLLNLPAGASEAEVLWKWVEALRELPAETSEILFRQAASWQNMSAAYLAGVARNLQQTRLTLAGENRSIAQVVNLLAAKEGEYNYETLERFSAFANLEQRYLQKLTDLTDDAANNILHSAVQPANVRTEVEKVVFIGCLELKQAVLSAVERLEIPVEHWLPVPDSELENFDEFGRPKPDYYLQTPIDFNVKDNLRFMATAEDEALKIVNTLKALPLAEYPAVIGVLDSQTADVLLDKCALDAELPEFYRPQTAALSSSPLAVLLAGLLDFAVAVPTFDSFMLLLRNGLVQNYLSTKIFGLDWFAVLAAWDDIQQRRVLSSCAEAWAYAQDKTGAEFDAFKFLYAERAAVLIADNQLYAVWEWAGRVVQSGNFVRGDFAELEPLKNLVADAVRLPIGNPLRITLFRLLLNSAVLSGDSNRDGQAELSGFLELGWRSGGGNLLIAGFNAENFNYGSTADIFLPEQLKRSLSMLTADNYYAADVVRFKHLSGCYNLQLLAARTGTDGTVLRPARLLMQVAAETLPLRCKELFGSELNEKLLLSPLPTELNGSFPPFLPVKVDNLLKNTISVTGFSTYLQCPFQYYRERILRCKELSGNGLEMDDMTWGTVLHKIVERYCRGRLKSAGRETENEILTQCRKLAAQVEAENFASGGSGLVGLQLELLEESLRGFATHQAGVMAENWHTVKVEQPFEVAWPRVFYAFFPEAEREAWRENLRLRGTIDRIDRRDAGGGFNWRIIDYKTGGKVQSPQDKHWGGKGLLPVTENVEEGAEAESVWRQVVGLDKEKYWQDLQLPLYMAGLKELNLPDFQADAVIRAAYFYVPLVYTEAGIKEFTELTENADILASAVNCADMVLKSIFVRRCFWPPRAVSNFQNSFADVLGRFNPADFLTPEFWRSLEEQR